MTLTPETIAIIAGIIVILGKLIDVLIDVVREQIRKTRNLDDKEKAAKNHILWPYIADLKKSQTQIHEEVAEVKKTADNIETGLYGEGRDGGLISEIKLHTAAISGLEVRVGNLEKDRDERR